MRTPTSRCLGPWLLLLCLVSPLAAEELSGKVGVGPKLDVYLFPEPSFFQRVLGAIGLAGPPEPVNLDQVAKSGRDAMVIGLTEEEDWGLFAKVRSDDETQWYAVGKPSSRFFEIKLKDGVVIRRVKKSAAQIFEGGVKGDPWFLQVQAPGKLAWEGESRPKVVGFKFWLEEFTYSFDEVTHSSSRKNAKRDNYTVLKEALVGALPHRLDPDSFEPEDELGGTRVGILKIFCGNATDDQALPLRELLEAKLAALPEAEDEPQERARQAYQGLLDELTRRSSDG